jgi:hypothetical protein
LAGGQQRHAHPGRLHVAPQKVVEPAHLGGM